jgi:hypothetical protein
VGRSRRGPVTIGRRLRGHHPQTIRQLRHLTVHGAEPLRGRSWSSDQYNVGAGEERRVPGGLPQQALGAVASHRVPDPARGDHRYARRGVPTLGGACVYRDEPTGALAPAPQHPGDLPTTVQTVMTDRGHGVQAESFVRPRRRRFFTTARPARVCMRARKPCFRARRRLFGWKVRFTAKPSRGRWVHTDVRRSSGFRRGAVRPGRQRPGTEPVVRRGGSTAVVPRRRSRTIPDRNTTGDVRCRRRCGRTSGEYPATWTHGNHGRRPRICCTPSNRRCTVPHRPPEQVGDLHPTAPGPRHTRTPGSRSAVVTPWWSTPCPSPHHPPRPNRCVDR